MSNVAAVRLLLATSVTKLIVVDIILTMPRSIATHSHSSGLDFQGGLLPQERILLKAYRYRDLPRLITFRGN
jgi:hypothetical protein